jgi:DNA invertase Pin-like site-specific DNA recombinase
VTVAEYLLYLRRSSGRKPLPRQRAITTGHVEKSGGTIIAEFPDADRTAARKVGEPLPVRPGFAAMLARLRAHREEDPPLHIAAWHADRLTRDSEDTEELIRVCAAGGHLVVTAAGGTYDLSTANGRKRFRDDANDAAYEVDHGRERVLAGRAEVAGEGRWLGGKRPFGWERDPSPKEADGSPMLDGDGKPVNGMLRLVQREADALARAHKIILDGGSAAGIATEWNRKEITTPSGKQWRGREVRRVLLRARNAGLMEYQGQVLGQARWEPIVEEGTWRSVTAILSDASRITTPGPGRKHLLTWLARCGLDSCGGPLICTSTSRTHGPRKLVYRCREYGGGHVARDASQLDDLITRMVIRRLSREDAADLLVKDHRDELAVLHRAANSVRELMAADRRLQLEGLITELEFAGGRRKHQEDLRDCLRRLEDLTRADVLAPLLGDPAAIWESLPLDRRRAVISALMSIRIMPAPKGRPSGWKPGKPYFDPRSVEITWCQDLP